MAECAVADSDDIRDLGLRMNLWQLMLVMLASFGFVAERAVADADDARKPGEYG